MIFVIQNAFDPFTQMNYVEIEKQTQRFVRKTQVGKQLSFVDWKQRFHAFESNNDCVCNEKIKPVTGV